jgi:hypothetical protein
MPRLRAIAGGFGLRGERRRAVAHWSRLLGLGCAAKGEQQTHGTRATDHQPVLYGHGLNRIRLKTPARLTLFPVCG